MVFIGWCGWRNGRRVLAIEDFSRNFTGIQADLFVIDREAGRHGAIGNRRAIGIDNRDADLTRSGGYRSNRRLDQV